MPVTTRFVNLWSPWCWFCQQFFPALVQSLSFYGSANISMKGDWDFCMSKPPAQHTKDSGHDGHDERQASILCWKQSYESRWLCVITIFPWKLKALTQFLHAFCFFLYYTLVSLLTERLGTSCTWPVPRNASHSSGVSSTASQHGCQLGWEWAFGDATAMLRRFFLSWATSNKAHHY